MPPYRVLIAKEVVAALASLTRREREAVARLFENLADDPFLSGDYAEKDNIGRPIQVLILGRLAILYWTDHAVKEVKVLDLKIADR